MPTTLPALRPVEGVTADQLELVKRTVAQGATADELKLFLYDCQRQGVHPLDKLLHFTKRAGRYTPITSIDFMRIRAAETGEYAGSDDAAFVAGESYPLEAHVTVWRLVQGQRCAFGATARWAEYYPGDKEGHMWRKMPHTMLAKCAEALALRKGFPRQLAGLYAREELDQAVLEPADVPAREDRGAKPEQWHVEDGEEPPLDSYDTVQAPPPEPDPPRAPPRPGTVRVVRIDSKPTQSKPELIQHRITLSDGAVVTTLKLDLAQQAKTLCEQGTPVLVRTKDNKYGGKDVVSFRDPTVERGIPF